MGREERVKAFLFAAGFGTRLGQLTREVPKPLVKVAGIPLVCYTLAALKQAGIEELVINLHYRGGQVKDFFHQYNNFGFKVTWSEEEEILGTGGGVMKCRSMLEDAPFLVMNSDVITDFFPGKLVEASDDEQVTTIVVTGNPGPGPTVSLDGDRVVDFRGVLKSGVKATCDYTGVALVFPDIFSYLEEGFSSIVYTGYTGLIQHGAGVRALTHDGLWMDAGTPEDLEHASSEEQIRDLSQHVRRVLGAHC